MAKNLVYEPGYKQKVTVTKPDAPDSGDPVVYGEINGIALADELADGDTVCDFGPFVADLSVEDTETGGIAIGDIVYIVPGTGALCNTATSNQKYGIAQGVVASAQTATIPVFHLPGF